MAETTKEKKKKSSTKLTCIITGKTTLFSEDYYAKKIQDAGTEEILKTTYCCKQAKSLLKRGYSVSEVRNILGAEGDVVDVDESTVKKILGTEDVTATPELEKIETSTAIKIFIQQLKDYE